MISWTYLNSNKIIVDAARGRPSLPCTKAAAIKFLVFALSPSGLVMAALAFNIAVGSTAE
jgi:hypothetical protein